MSTNTAPTKRKDRRFRAYVPIRLTAGTSFETLVPRDISISGCYFDFSRPSSVGGICDLEVPLGGSRPPLKIANANFFDRKNNGPGFGFTWTLNAGLAAEFYSHLVESSNEPSTHSKVHFLANEQNRLMRTLRELSVQKQKSYRFLFALVAAYFAYLSAPLHFVTITTVEQAVFYAIGGVWASAILLYQSLRFLKWLGTSVRLRAFLFHALSANRAWVFNNDGSYYGKSLFPFGVTYEKDRTYNKKEKYPLTLDYSWSTTLFHFLVQSLYAFGAILFLSIIGAAIQEKAAIVSSGFHLFDAHYFQYVYSHCCIFLILWIQFCGNVCGSYQKAIWEAHRISVDRPNPRFGGAALRTRLAPLYYVLQFGLYVIFAYGCAAFFVSVLHHYDVYVPSTIYGFLTSWGRTTILLLILLLGKIFYINMQIREESTVEDGKTSPITETEQER